MDASGVSVRDIRLQDGECEEKEDWRRVGATCNFNPRFGSAFPVYGPVYL